MEIRFGVLMRGGVYLAVLLLLWSGNAVAQAGKKGKSPTAQKIEAGYLLRYAFLICAMSSYQRLDPPPQRIVKMLRDEAWGYVEIGSVGANAYQTLYPLSVAKGKTIPARAAMRRCLRWSESEVVNRLVAGFVNSEGG